MKIHIIEEIELDETDMTILSVLISYAPMQMALHKRSDLMEWTGLSKAVVKGRLEKMAVRKIVEWLDLGPNSSGWIIKPFGRRLYGDHMADKFSGKTWRDWQPGRAENH